MKPIKVLLINGSPRKEGNTATALAEVANQLEKEGIESETVWIGNKPIRGCAACGQCTAIAISGNVHTIIFAMTMQQCFRCRPQHSYLSVHHFFCQSTIVFYSIGFLVIFEYAVTATC